MPHLPFVEDAAVAEHPAPKDTRPATDYQRRTRIAGCSECDLVQRHGGFGPPHDASPRCESGKHEHCTCDGCF